MQAALTLVAAVMSIQTTLFGGVLVLKDVQHIYKVPRNAYEKFIEYDVKGGRGGVIMLTSQ